MEYSDFLKKMTNKEILQKAWKRIKDAKAERLTHHQLCSEVCSVISFDSMIDAGPGSIGSEAWSMNALNPECNIYGFEPGEDRYDLLKKANYPGVLSKLALSDFEGVLEGGMGFEEGNSDFRTNANILCYDLDMYKKTTVECTTIDRIVEKENLDNIFIWADIEGAELVLLKGAKKTFLEKKIRGLCVELNFHVDPTQTSFCSYHSVINLLDEYGFCSAVRVKPFIYQKLPFAGTHKDYIFLPKDHPYFGSEAYISMIYRDGGSPPNE